MCKRNTGDDDGDEWPTTTNKQFLGDQLIEKNLGGGIDKTGEGIDFGNSYRKKLE